MHFPFPSTHPLNISWKGYQLHYQIFFTLWPIIWFPYNVLQNVFWTKSHKWRICIRVKNNTLGHNIEMIFGIKKDFVQISRVGIILIWKCRQKIVPQPFNGKTKSLWAVFYMYAGFPATDKESSDKKTLNINMQINIRLPVLNIQSNKPVQFIIASLRLRTLCVVS